VAQDLKENPLFALMRENYMMKAVQFWCHPAKDTTKHPPPSDPGMAHTTHTYVCAYTCLCECAYTSRKD